MPARKTFGSVPNKNIGPGALHGPWHALLAAALGLSRLLEGEMDRALAIVGLTAPGFVALLEISTGVIPGDETPAAGGPAGRAAEIPAAGSARQTIGAADGLTQVALRERLGTSRAATSELLARLERQRLIQRRGVRAPAGNARRGRPGTEIALTGAGHLLLAAAARIARKVEEGWARRLARESAGTDFHYARASGLTRWLSEGLAALRAGSGGERRRRRRRGAGAARRGALKGGPSPERAQSGPPPRRSSRPRRRRPAGGPSRSSPGIRGRGSTHPRTA